MFFLSLCPDDAGDAARILAIHQTFKNVKKYYRLIKIITVPRAMGDDDITAAVAKIWRDKDYSAHKRLFSQDRRPSRVVRENPRLIANCASAGERLVHDLRRLDIPVEGFFIQPSDLWSRESLGKALGDNYRVRVFDLVCAVATVYAQNRLDLTHCAARADGLVHEIDKIKAALMENDAESGFADRIKPSDLFLALSMPVWFRENIHYHRPYRA
jgi:hypothetical protein